MWRISALIGLSVSLSFSGVTYADPMDDVVVSIQNPPAQDAAANAKKDAAVRKDEAGDVIMHAMGLLGVAYRFGGSNPNQGLDCSGFIQYVFKSSMRVNLPRTAAQMAKTGQEVERSNLKAGDLVFFNTRGFPNSHVGLFIGNDKFMHAPRAGKNVEVVSLSNKYWSARFNGARRIDSSSKAAAFVNKAADASSTPALKLETRKPTTAAKAEVKPAEKAATKNTKATSKSSSSTKQEAAKNSTKKSSANDKKSSKKETSAKSKAATTNSKSKSATTDKKVAAKTKKK